MKQLRYTLLIAVLVLAAAPTTFSQKNFQTTVILISIDGMRYDYLDLYKPPALTQLAKDGVRAKWMKPAYPSKTFPNHYTVATGLYPGNHWLIENNMWDAATGKVFGLGDRDAVQDPSWWGGEPIWITAQKQGLIAGAFFYPGTETPISGMRPKYWRPYDGKVPNDERVDTVLSWFDMPQEERPRIITMYFSDVDDAGHAHGPESPEAKEALLGVDRSIAGLVDGLQKKGADKTTDLIIFSDHGMAPYKMRDAIVLDRYFDLNDAARIFWVGEFIQIFPKQGLEKRIYDSIRRGLPATAKIYRKADLPKRLKLGKAMRLAPLLVIPEPGTVITNEERYAKAVKEETLEKVRGGHGYDNAHPLMRATFIASGPQFKKGFVAEPFESVDIYNLMTRLLALKPAKNDGKWRRIKQVLK